MLLEQHIDVGLTQEQIADEFELWVPTGEGKKYSNAKETIDEIKWGINLRNADINNFLQRIHAPLSENYVPVNTIQDWEFEETIARALGNGCHVVCGYSYGTLHNGTSVEAGHVSLIESIDSSGRVCMVDPGPENAGYVSVTSHDLFKAIHHKKDGLWIICKTGCQDDKSGQSTQEN